MFIEVEKKLFKYLCRSKRTLNSQNNCEEEQIRRYHTLILNYTTKVCFITLKYGLKTGNWLMNQTSELTYRPPHMWSTSVWQAHKSIIWRNTISSINEAAGKNLISTCKRMKLDSNLMPLIKLSQNRSNISMY